MNSVTYDENAVLESTLERGWSKPPGISCLLFVLVTLGKKNLGWDSVMRPSIYTRCVPYSTQEKYPFSLLDGGVLVAQ